MTVPPNRRSQFVVAAHRALKSARFAIAHQSKTTIGTSTQDATASGGISGRLSITLSTKPKSLAISAVIK